MKFIKKVATLTLIVFATFFFVKNAIAKEVLLNEDMVAEQRLKKEKIIKRIEQHLAKMTTLKARFDQISSNGSKSGGTLYIERPKKLRMEYDPPVPVLLLADGDSLIYHDKELMQTTYMDIDSNPVGVILSEHPSLSAENIDVKYALTNELTTEIGFTFKDDPAVGSVSLIFKNDPFDLVQWYVIDAQGVETIVMLKDIEKGLKFEKDFFKIKEDARLNLLEKLDRH
jgi:outer membrane lipoprotein-sorting protein